MCAPGVELDDVFAVRPAWQQDAYEALVAPLRDLGDLHEDPVAVGVFLKRQRKLAEIRPMATRLRVLAFLPGEVASDAVIRREAIGDRVLHVVDLRGPGEVDGALVDLLVQAWEDAG